MFWSLGHLIGWVVSALGSRKDLILENLALRQQLLALHSQRRRPRLSVRHKLFWVLLRRLWSGWKTPLLLVTPRTVVEWHRAGFRLYWNWLSRARQVGGRKPLSQEIRALIFRMAAENPTWLRPGKAVGTDCLKGGLIRPFVPSNVAYEGGSGEVTDRSKPSDNVPTPARVAPEPRGEGVSASIRRRRA